MGFEHGNCLGELRGASERAFVVGEELSEDRPEQAGPQSDVVHVPHVVEGRHWSPSFELSLSHSSQQSSFLLGFKGFFFFFLVYA